MTCQCHITLLFQLKVSWGKKSCGNFRIQIRKKIYCEHFRLNLEVHVLHDMMIMSVEFAVILVANKSRLKSAATENGTDTQEDQIANTWKTLFKNMVKIFPSNISFSSSKLQKNTLKIYAEF